MNKSQAKKIVLSQLAAYLRHEVIVDGVDTESDLVVFQAAQDDLIVEFERRGRGALVPDRLNKTHSNR